jgi:NAD(P)-dependent dehydrogenase (short-subunit alcohol dehydrogenase family)
MARAEYQLAFEGKVIVVVGAGQTPGTTTGNGRASALVYAREGGTVVCVDRDLGSVEETVGMIQADGGTAVALRADVTVEADIGAVVAKTVETFGRIDVLHNNVGQSLAGGDAPIEDVSADAFDAVTAINLRGMVMTCKHVLTVMRAQRSGSIVSISSTAAVLDYPYIAYKTSKAGVIALTENIAIRFAPFGIRANCILPGLMDTPMAIENRVGISGATREEVKAGRSALVPLGAMGTAWDTAEAAAFLASDKARFITGVALRVDGGQCLKIG